MKLESIYDEEELEGRDIEGRMIKSHWKCLNSSNKLIC